MKLEQMETQNKRTKDEILCKKYRMKCIFWQQFCYFSARYYQVGNYLCIQITQWKEVSFYEEP